MLLVDPETGEPVEVHAEAVVGPQEPYDYAGFRRSCMTASMEHRRALSTLEVKETEAAQAEARYRRELATQLLLAKVEHGATAAEAIAKGTDEVSKAHEAMLIAQAKARGAMEKVRLCRDDAQRLSAMGYWSREANADGWQERG